MTNLIELQILDRREFADGHAFGDVGPGTMSDFRSVTVSGDRNSSENGSGAPVADQCDDISM